MLKKAALLVILLSCFTMAFEPVSLVFAGSSPNLISPSLASTNSDTSPSLSWTWSGTCFSSGSCYRIQVDDQQDFSSTNKDSYTSNTSYSPQLTQGTWYWRVKAKDSSSTWSDWSEVWNFTIEQSKPNPPPTPATDPKVSLSEFMPNPGTGDEWVEIYNISSSEADLNGWKIDDATGFSSPTTIKDALIAPNSYKVFYFASKLNNSGDTLRLLRADDSEYETVDYGPTTKDVAFAKDSAGFWQQTTNPTPGTDNKISTGAVLAATDENKDNQTQTSSPNYKLDVLKEITATPSTQSERPIKTESKTVKSEPKTFLSVIFVGGGILLVLMGMLFFLLKSGYLKKWQRKDSI